MPPRERVAGLAVNAKVDSGGAGDAPAWSSDPSASYEENGS